VSVPGFRLAAVHAGLKPNGQLDLALVRSDTPCTAAAIFTQNLFQGAPVLFDRKVLAAHRRNVQAVVINSKVANAATGPAGLADAEQMARWTRRCLAWGEHVGVMVMSTGVIGVRLPMDKIQAGIQEAAGSLGGDPLEAARAIMTTDTRPKTASAQAGAATVWGMAKGAGMIHPDMATMLVVILTDAAIPAEVLQGALYAANDTSFRCITVDGDTSPNDTCLVLANGLAGDVDPTVFRTALGEVCESLARQVAFDGEGARHHVTIHVQGARSAADARQIGRTIATSPLVKTAIFGRDANWGRVISAAGRAGVPFDPLTASLCIDDLAVFDKGQPVAFDEARALELLSKTEVSLHLDVGSGPGQATVWTCDLTPEYVDINAAYRS
jgi:glutamate N-acetyltransferase/amino-acid N-acetyltransferase